MLTTSFHLRKLVVKLRPPFAKEKAMMRRVHGVAAVLSLIFIATFWASTVISELLLSLEAVTAVKHGIAYALAGFIPVIMITATTGFAMSRKGTHPLVGAKRRRMPFIALNGLLVLLPLALYLYAKAKAGEFDAWFYPAQILEFIAGAANIILIGLNIRDGLRLRGHRGSEAYYFPLLLVIRCAGPK